MWRMLPNVVHITFFMGYEERDEIEEDMIRWDRMRSGDVVVYCTHRMCNTFTKGEQNKNSGFSLLIHTVKENL